jgi:sirohydrochlorin cobaltochelatase
LNEPNNPRGDASSFVQVEARIRLLLPPQYQDRYEQVQPVSMGSAGLRYGPDGKVAWDTIWRSFCDLALAGGPPHRGTLLKPGTREDIAANRELYQTVQAEICRGLVLVTGLFAEPSADPGWVRMYCTSAGMAAWLARAIVTENVSARAVGLSLYLPAGPGYRVQNEIKNVITATAKTCHSWLEHMQPEQHWKISKLFREMQAESPLIEPGAADHGIRTRLGEAIHAATGLQPSQNDDAAWLGLRCPTVQAAVWRMRVLVVLNLYSRREQDVVFVPLNAATDPQGESVLRAVRTAHAFARAQAIL